MGKIMRLIIVNATGCFIALALISLIDVRSLWYSTVEKYREITTASTLSDRFCEIMGENIYKIGGENDAVSVVMVRSFVSAVAKNSHEKGNRYAYTDAQELFFDPKTTPATEYVSSYQGMQLFLNTCKNMAHREARRLQAKQ